MRTRILTVLKRTSLLLLLPVATIISLHLNMLNRVTPWLGPTVYDLFNQVLRTFALNNGVYFAALFITLFLVIVKGVRINTFALILTAAFTMILAIPHIQSEILSVVNEGNVVFILIFQLFFDPARTLFMLTNNIVIYILLIIKERQLVRVVDIEE